MKRRQLIVLLGGATLFTASLVKAKQASSAQRIGIFVQDLQPGLLDNFRAGLHDLGYDEGKNISIRPMPR
jgi:hypothetical protein